MRMQLSAPAAVAAALLLSMLGFGESKGGESDHARERSADISRGRYLVQITGCNDCHTSDYAARNGDVDEANWLTGSRVGFEGPWGTTYPPNLRLLISELTPEQWLMHARKRTRPPMPWFSLRHMTDEDLTAMYRFIRSLGPAGTPAPAYEPPKHPPKNAEIRRWRIEEAPDFSHLKTRTNRRVSPQRPTRR